MSRVIAILNVFVRRQSQFIGILVTVLQKCYKIAPVAGLNRSMSKLQLN